MTRIIQDTTASLAYNLIRQRRDTLPAGKTWQEYDNALRDLTMSGGNGEPTHAPDPQHQRPGYGYWCICNVRFQNPYALAAHVASANVPAPRTGDYTLTELFPSEKGWIKTLQYGAWCCQECGAIVNDSKKHVTWHNKLLP